MPYTLFAHISSSATVLLKEWKFYEKQINIWVPWPAINKVYFKCRWAREFNLHTQKEVVVTYSVAVNLPLPWKDWSLAPFTSVAWKYIIVSHYGFLSRPLGIVALCLTNPMHRIFGSRYEWVSPRIFMSVAVLLPGMQGCVRHNFLPGNTGSHIAWFWDTIPITHNHEWCPWNCAVCNPHVNMCDSSRHLAEWV